MLDKKGREKINNVLRRLNIPLNGSEGSTQDYMKVCYLEDLLKIGYTHSHLGQGRQAEILEAFLEEFMKEKVN